MEQVVIRGGGFRQPSLSNPWDRTDQGLLEVDHPMSQAEKKKAVAERLGRLPPHVTFVPIDFSTGLTRWTPGCPAPGTARRPRPSSCARGSRIICRTLSSTPCFGSYPGALPGVGWSSRTFIGPFSLGRRSSAGADKTLATVRRSGEPYSFGFWTLAELRQYLTARDLIPDRRRRRQYLSRTLSETPQSWARAVGRISTSRSCGDRGTEGELIWPPRRPTGGDSGRLPAGAAPPARSADHRIFPC